MTTSPTINSVHGRIRSITGTDPAAGAEISETVPDRRRWKIHAIRLRLTTTAGGAARIIKLLIDDGTNELIEHRLTTSQAESLTYRYSFFNYNGPEFSSGINIMIPFAPITLLSGFRIQTSTSNIDAADDFSAPHFLIEEWIDP